VKTGSYGSDFVVGSLIDMNYKCRCFKEALGFFFLKIYEKKRDFIWFRRMQWWQHFVQKVKLKWLDWKRGDLMILLREIH
jgi:hypothetical protein